MSKELNLAEILKGHEGETFYNSLFGDIKLSYIDKRFIVFTYDLDSCELFVKHNGNSKETDELAVFPSKDQRNWKIWNIENNYPGPKTWSELLKIKGTREYFLNCLEIGKGLITITNSTPLEKAAIALLKISQLIDAGYGGQVTNEDIAKPLSECMIYGITYDYREKEFLVMPECSITDTLVSFYTEELAEKFLSYPENVELLKDLRRV